MSDRAGFSPLSGLATAVRFGLGSAVGAGGPRPAGPLELYEFETCPFCRKVREMLVWLDVDVDVRPCPPGGTRYRPEAVRRGGRKQFPLLVDGDALVYESDDIVARLAARHGDGAVPAMLRLGPLTTLTSAAASLLSGPRVRPLPSRAPAQPLELFADETSSAARRVRTLLCALELPYRWRTCGRGSAKLAELRARTGDDTLPALLDPNTGADLRGADAALEHLRATWSA